jgi:hypothetical protein
MLVQYFLNHKNMKLFSTTSVICAVSVIFNMLFQIVCTNTTGTNLYPEFRE